MKKAIPFMLCAFTLFCCTKDKSLKEQQFYLNANGSTNAVPVNATVNQSDTTNNNSSPIKKKVVKIKYPKQR
ncbi:hypothetical protein BH10BAC2_BH10BAC2_41590 [soil metagenome]